MAQLSRFRVLTPESRNISVKPAPAVVSAEATSQSLSALRSASCLVPANMREKSVTLPMSQEPLLVSGVRPSIDASFSAPSNMPFTVVTARVSHLPTPVTLVRLVAPRRRSARLSTPWMGVAVGS